MTGATNFVDDINIFQNKFTSKIHKHILGVSHSIDKSV